MSWLRVIFPPLVLGASLLVMYLAVRRFERKQRELGRWDEYGPLEETERPPREVRGDMSERLEVIGRWKGKVLRRRRPGEKP